PLKFDEASWQRIVERFRARGQEARPIQRQQCFFPEGAEILENPAGTANAFRFQVQRHGRPALHVYVMPGPPVEIDAVWKLHYINVVDGIVPLSLREELHIFRTLGPGESTIAEIVEPLIQGHGVRVGYRAHLPYVEVKLWIKRGYSANEVLASIQRELGTSLVATGDEDLADAMISVFAGQTVAIRDGVTRGEFEARLRERLPQEFSGAVSVETAFGSVATAPVEPVVSVGLRFELHERQNKGEFWSVTVKNSSGVVCELEVQPTPLYKFGTERGRKYFTEKVFHLFKTEVLPKLTK
ncbi:MAG TPA: hypothetical protein VM432_02005, partial [Bdellovibrionales bacterium]|nr:hypothetical protein [Bdellovibrionales bacterium]